MVGDHLEIIPVASDADMDDITFMIKSDPASPPLPAGTLKSDGTLQAVS